MANRFLIVCGGTGYRLLGQRSILGFDAELQIDVSREIVSRDWKIKDQRSLFVDLDERIGTTAIAFNALQEMLNYTKGDSSDKSNINFLTEYFPAAQNLEFGLAQSPAVGNAAIRHPYNQRKLEETIRKMISQFGRAIGPQNPIEAWIVSSTGGGTGEGTHLFVASTIAKVMHETFVDTNLLLNFIRVGSLTYRSVNIHSTGLNTFFGIAADSAYILKLKNEHPWATTHWFYVDLPDVGKGDRAKRVRGEIVENACKAIMLPDIRNDLESLVGNNNGSPIVLVRTGYWKKELNQQQNYYETLKELARELNDFIEPEYASKFIEGQPNPEIISRDLEIYVREIRNDKFIFEKLDNGWGFPRYQLPSLPISIDQFSKALSNWNISINALFKYDIKNIDIGYKIGMFYATLNVPSAIEESGNWFKTINSIHRSRAWALYLLGISSKDRLIQPNGLIADLVEQSKTILNAFHKFYLPKGAIAKKISTLLEPFIQTLAQVNYLLSIEEATFNLLNKELSECKIIQKIVKNELLPLEDIYNNSLTAKITKAVQLDQITDSLAGKTWLRVLRDAIRMEDLDVFRQAVLRGAIGLTHYGLCHVLGLPDSSDVSAIHKLMSELGQIDGINRSEFAGQWWQATKPKQDLKYSYRIFPLIDQEMRNQLESQPQSDSNFFAIFFLKRVLLDSQY